MHVHSHFRHFALQPKTPAQTRETRKKAAGLENSERVESRFAKEDEDDTGRGGGQRRPFHAEKPIEAPSGHNRTGAANLPGHCACHLSGE